MPPSFRATHIPVLFAGTATFFGGLWPLFGSAQAALLEYGFPARIASTPETWPVFVAGNGRTTALGAVLLTFYWRGQLEAADTVLAVMATYLGVLDCYVLWGMEGVSGGWPVFRLVSSWALAAAGWSGMASW